MKLRLYGRRIVTLENTCTKEQKKVFSGQWVGHLYGWQWGTAQQRANVLKNHPGHRVKSISKKIIWGAEALGYVEEETRSIEPGTPLKKEFQENQVQAQA